MAESGTEAEPGKDTPVGARANVRKKTAEQALGVGGGERESLGDPIERNTVNREVEEQRPALEETPQRQALELGGSL